MFVCGTAPTGFYPHSQRDALPFDVGAPGAPGGGAQSVYMGPGGGGGGGGGVVPAPAQMAGGAAPAQGQSVYMGAPGGGGGGGATSVYMK